MISEDERDQCLGFQVECMAVVDLNFDLLLIASIPLPPLTQLVIHIQYLSLKHEPPYRSYVIFVIFIYIIHLLFRHDYLLFH